MNPYEPPSEPETTVPAPSQVRENGQNTPMFMAGVLLAFIGLALMATLNAKLSAIGLATITVGLLIAKNAEE